MSIEFDIPSLVSQSNAVYNLDEDDILKCRTNFLSVVEKYYVDQDGTIHFVLKSNLKHEFETRPSGGILLIEEPYKCSCCYTHINKNTDWTHSLEYYIMEFNDGSVLFSVNKTNVFEHETFPMSDIYMLLFLGINEEFINSILEKHDRFRDACEDGCDCGDCHSIYEYYINRLYCDDTIAIQPFLNLKEQLLKKVKIRKINDLKLRVVESRIQHFNFILNHFIMTEGPKMVCKLDLDITNEISTIVERNPI